MCCIALLDNNGICFEFIAMKGTSKGLNNSLSLSLCFSVSVSLSFPLSLLSLSLSLSLFDPLSLSDSVIK